MAGVRDAEPGFVELDPVRRDDDEPPPRHVTGFTGTLRVGYQTAASLESWSVAITPEGASFVATVVSRHDYWSTLGPLDLVLDVGRERWCWRAVVVRLDPTADHLELTLPGRPEVER